MRAIAGGIAVLLIAAGSAQAAPITLTTDANAGKPGVAVSPDGTGHVAWSARGPGPDQVVYCRLPRGASACASTTPFTPDPLESFGGVRVLAPTNERILLIFYRCCGGAAEGTSVMESADGGQTFGAARRIGDLEPWEAVLGPGDQTVSLTNHVITAGVDYQAGPLGGGTPGHADVGLGLGDTDSDHLQGYWGSTAFIDAQTPIVTAQAQALTAGAPAWPERPSGGNVPLS